MRHLRRLLPYLRRYKGSYLTGLGFTLLATLCGMTVPLLVRHAVNRLEHYATAKLILHASLAIILFALVRGALLVLGRFRILAASRRIEFDLRNDLFAHLEKLPARYYDANATGDITSRAINDLDGVRMMIGIGIQSLSSTGLMFLSSLAVMFYLNPRLAALCTIPLGLISVVMAWTGTKIHDLSLAVQSQLSELSSRAHENFSGARVVRAFVQEQNEIGRFRGAALEYASRGLRLAKWRALSWALMLLLAEAAIVVTLFAGGRMMMDGTFSKGDLAAFTAYQFLLVWPMIAIGWVVNLVQRGVVCLERLAEIFDTPADTDDSRAAAGPGPLRGRIEARNLTFAYAADRPAALSNVSLTIEPGQKIALVGRTGAGKTTFAQLLLRLYRVPDGMLFIDGRDINTIPLSELRDAIGAVPQDLFLFSEKIRENIAFGGANGVADEDVLRAAELSRLSADVDRFPDRYDQMIGERGVTLSGGQKQRTALARAVIRAPRILILDDALSSVDSHTEREIQDRLREFMKGRTSLLITHRLSAITDADRIFVLEEGRLAEEGRHPELLARSGTYAGLWERQKLHEEIAGK